MYLHCFIVVLYAVYLIVETSRIIKHQWDCKKNNYFLTVSHHETKKNIEITRSFKLLSNWDVDSSQILWHRFYLLDL